MSSYDFVCFLLLFYPPYHALFLINVFNVIYIFFFCSSFSHLNNPRYVIKQKIRTYFTGMFPLPPGEPVRHRNNPRRVPQLRRRRPVLPDRAGEPAGLLHPRHALPVRVSRRLSTRRRRHGRQGVSQDVQNQETLFLRTVELVRGR